MEKTLVIFIEDIFLIGNETLKYRKERQSTESMYSEIIGSYYFRLGIETCLVIQRCSQGAHTD